MSSKGGLHHDSSCSTYFREGDLGEGSLSCLVSEDAPGCTAPGRHMILVQLKRLAPLGRLTSDCSERVPCADRTYDLLLEPGEARPPLTNDSPRRPWDEGVEPWQSSLRRKQKVQRPRFRPSAPPLHLVSALAPPSPPKRSSSKTRRPAPPTITAVRYDEIATAEDAQPEQAQEEQLDLAATIYEMAKTPSDCGNELDLPTSLESETGHRASATSSTAKGSSVRGETSARSKDLVHWAFTWPLNSPGEASASLSSGNRSQQLEPLKRSTVATVGAEKLAVPHRYSVSVRRLSERRRSWLKASEASSKGKNPGFLSQRNQLREMVSTMMKTMTQTFDRSVWASCDVLHPDEELEQANAKQKKVLEEQIDQFRGLKPAIKGRQRSQRRESVRRSFGITAGMDAGILPGTAVVTPPVTASNGAEKPDEKVLAHLAKQTNWSVLDVEEVWEIFSTRAPTGRIAVQSPDFILLVQEIYHGVTDEEIMLLQQHMRAVRTRNKARSRMMRKALTGLDATADKSDVRFSEFYVALVKWLTLQEARFEASRHFFGEKKHRCSLSRFSYQEAEKNYQNWTGRLERQRTADKKFQKDALGSDSEKNHSSDDEDLQDPSFLSRPPTIIKVSSQRSSCSSGPSLL